MKKFPTILSVLLIFALTGCSGASSGQTETAAPASVETEQQTETAGESFYEEDIAEDLGEVEESRVNEDIPEADEAFSMEDYTEPVCGSITNDGPVYQDERITITAENFETDSTSTYLFLSIENTSDQDLSISCTTSILNDFVISSSLYEDLPANEKAETALEFDNAMINACGIHTITSAELTFAVFELESSALLTETDTLTVTTDAGQEDAQSDIATGDLLYSNDNRQIIFKGIIEDDDDMAMIALLFINQSDQDVVFDLTEDGFVIDGTSYLTAFSQIVPSGRNALALISSYDPETGVIPFEQTAELTFSISDTETWDVIDVTEPITISAESVQ